MLVIVSIDRVGHQAPLSILHKVVEEVVSLVVLIVVVINAR